MNTALTRGPDAWQAHGPHDPRRGRRDDPPRDPRRGARARGVPGDPCGRRARGADPLPGRSAGPGPARPDAARAVRGRGLPDPAGASRQVPIIMLTARDGEVDKVVGLELGADDYVTKPFSLRELTARIRAIFRRAEQAGRGPGRSRVIDLGRVQVDLAGHRVLRDGQAVPLKPKAFELLAFLVRNPGQVFTRDQLLERVWGYDYAGETRTVDVHVHWLRAELEEDPAAPQLLHTVRGVGYVFRRPA